MNLWAFLREKNVNIKEALNIAQHNLGFYAGYYDDETRKRVEELFFCEYPVFGSIKENEPLTPKEAFELGKKRGKK